VGYDASSKVLTAKIRLGEGTSLNLGKGVGQDGSVQRIGIRKRLSRFWTLITDYSQISDSGGVYQSGLSAFLEWMNRY
ncbi:hypothetical protein EBZ37_13605, partial [bacterium]|nr:hypothetical protein [bacterium]